MIKTIQVYNKIGQQGRSRVNASKLKLNELNDSDFIILDFSGVDFLSRSFTDEIITQLGKRKYKIVNANSIITNMFNAVVKGRNTPRSHKDDHSVVMMSFSNMADLSQYLNSKV